MKVSAQPHMRTLIEFGEGSATARLLIEQEVSRDKQMEKADKTALAAKIRRMVRNGKDLTSIQENACIALAKKASDIYLLIIALHPDPPSAVNR